MSRILLISHIFPPAVDGGSRVIFKLGQYLETQNHQTLYLSSDCSSTDDFTKNKFIKSPKLNPNQIKLPVYHYLRRPLKFISLFFPKKSYFHQFLNVFQKGPIFKFTPFITTTIEIIKFKPDLIIAGPLPTTTILYANFLKKITYSKLLVNASFHPTDPDFHQKPLIKTLQFADYLWTLTQFETDYFIKNFHINPQKIILTGNGVDSNFLDPCPVKGKVREGFNILFIGSFSAHKGIDTLIKSFSRINNLQSAKLTLAGQKTLCFPKISKLIKQQPKEIQKNINLVFNFPQSKLSQLIDNCDVLILPSKQESFGLVLIEALARSKPIITSNIPALSEIVQKTNGGLTFQVDSSADLTQKIKEIINNPKLANQLGQNGFNYVKNNYTWSNVGKNICQRITSL